MLVSFLTWHFDRLEAVEERPDREEEDPKLHSPCYSSTATTFGFERAACHRERERSDRHVAQRARLPHHAEERGNDFAHPQVAAVPCRFFKIAAHTVAARGRPHRQQSEETADPSERVGACTAQQTIAITHRSALAVHQERKRQGHRGESAQCCARGLCPRGWLQCQQLLEISSVYIYLPLFYFMSFTLAPTPPPRPPCASSRSSSASSPPSSSPYASSPPRSSSRTSHRAC